MTGKVTRRTAWPRDPKKSRTKAADYETLYLVEKAD